MARRDHERRGTGPHAAETAVDVEMEVVSELRQQVTQLWCLVLIGKPCFSMVNYEPTIIAAWWFANGWLIDKHLFGMAKLTATSK